MGERTATFEQEETQAPNIGSESADTLSLRTVPRETDMVEQIQGELLQFGLTPNEARIFLFLARVGSRKASEVAISLSIHRTETYHLLTGLQNKGLVSATFQHPIKFIATPLEKAIDLLISIEREKISIVERRKDQVFKIWENLPSWEQEEAPQERFQVLAGTAPVHLMAKQMLEKARKSVQVVSSEADLGRLYHSGFMDVVMNVVKKGTDFKLVGTITPRSKEILKGIAPSKVRQVPPTDSTIPHFVLIDNKELLLFLGNEGTDSKNLSAVWANYAAMTNAMHLLFQSLWMSGTQITGSKQNPIEKAA